MKISNSTYGVKTDWSYKGEEFWGVALHWRPGSRDILKIRVAAWSPKFDRSNQSIFYYEVANKEEVKILLTKFSDFDFKAVEQEYEKMWNKDNYEDKGYFNTGETADWFINKFFPYIREKYPEVKILNN